MSELIRFGVSIDANLLENFDRLIAERSYENRSEALRDLIRDALIQQKIETHGETQALGSLTVVYDHHARNLPKDMGEIQHEFHENILSVMHLHVNHDDCLEIIALKGVVAKITELSDTLLSLKGIKHGKLFLTFPSSEITSS
ncbi:MAG: nickel-responsive transcriptional regulator NikR [Aridibacter sp.]